ncbi:MAG TPA: acyltransferase family protein [Lentzea sp.]
MTAVQSPTGPSTTAPSTAPSTARLAGIDLARGLAVFGMFAAHVGPDPSEGGVTGALMEFAQGRSSALFAVLAGLSLAIMTGRQEPATGGGRRVAVRGVILLLFGTALTMTGTSVQVILAYYGVYFLLALPFTRLRAQALAVIAAVTAIAGPLLSFGVRWALGESGWDQLITASDPLEAIGGEGLLRLLFTGTYPVATWMPFVFAGMALGRMDLTATATRIRLAITGPVLAIIGYGGSALATSIFEVEERFSDKADGSKDLIEGAVNIDSPSMLLAATPHSGTPFEIVGNIGVAITILVAALAVTTTRAWLWRPITAVGSMSLTAYVLHVIAIGLLGLSAQQGEPGIVLLEFIGGAIVFALVWSRFFRRGPLEFLLYQATAKR